MKKYDPGWGRTIVTNAFFYKHSIPTELLIFQTRIIRNFDKNL